MTKTMPDIPVTNLEELLHHVEKRILSKYWKYAELDEWLQEARIHAWQDYEAGYTNRAEIVKRAANRVRNLITEGTGAAPTGKPVKDKQIYANERGNAMRTKIKQFITEYVSLHDKKPTQTAIAAGVGTSIANVSRHMKRLHAFDASRATDAKEVAMPGWVEEGFFNPDGVDAEYGCFENDLIRRISIADYLNRLPEIERAAIYYKFWEDRTNRGIAEGIHPLGTGGCSDQVGMNWVNKGVDRLRILMAAEHD